MPQAVGLLYFSACRHAPAPLRWGYSSVGRAFGWQPKGHRFEPGYLHHLPPFLLASLTALASSSGIGMAAGAPAEKAETTGETLAPRVRLWEIDTLRGCAVLAMMVFHFAWDWAYANGTMLGPNSRFFSGAIALTFIGVLGLSISLDRARVRATGGSLLRRTAWRFALLAGCAALVTLATRLVMPYDFVYFGILHLLAVCTLMVGLTAPLGAVANAAIGVLIIALGFGGLLDGPAPATVFSVLGWWAPRPTIDWYPIVPWSGFAFLGFAAGLLLYPSGRRRFALPDWSRPSAPLRFLGRHALPIYLVHQAVLFPLALLLALLLS